MTGTPAGASTTPGPHRSHTAEHPAPRAARTSSRCESPTCTSSPARHPAASQASPKMAGSGLAQPTRSEYTSKSNGKPRPQRSAKELPFEDAHP